MGTCTNSGGDVKQGHKQREQDSNREQRIKGASEAAMERCTYAGSSSRTGVKRKARGDKEARQTKSEGRKLHELSEGPSS